MGEWASFVETRAGRRTVSEFANIASTAVAGETVVPLFELQNGFPGFAKARHDLLVNAPALQPLSYQVSGSDSVAAAYTLGLVDTYLRTNGLLQMDRLTMHHSVEGRTPLVDYQLFELVLSGRLGKDGLFTQPKALLREAAAQLLPADVLRRPKRGFTPPVRDWVRAIWSANSEVVSDPLLARISHFRGSEVSRRMRSPMHRSGRVDHVAVRLMSLELWYRGLVSPPDPVPVNGDTATPKGV